MPSRTRDPWTYTLLLLAALNLANGGWMLLRPEHWYYHLPAAVPAFGPFNSHFVRDIGCTFLAMGLVLAAAALAPRLRLGAVAAVALWYLLHALLHVYDTARGAVASDHWRHDLVGVYLTALAFGVCTLLLWRRHRHPQTTA